MGYYRRIVLPGMSSSISESDVSLSEHSKCMQFGGKEVCIVYLIFDNFISLTVAICSNTLNLFASAFWGFT